MLGKASVRLGLGLLFVSGCAVFFISGIVSCGTAPTPFVISGPGQFGNELPTLEITQPVEDITVGQGDPFLIRWTDTDRDNNASISFRLVNTATNAVITLISNISEDSDGASEENHIASTTLIPPGAYHLLGTIDDGVNSAVDVFARVAGDIGIRRVVVTVAEPGVIPPTIPPIVAVTEPVFNLSVSQDDVLVIVVQPRELAAAQGAPFDPDSAARLFILLDVDLNPNNDDPANPDPAQIIVLEERAIQEGSAATEVITVVIDLELIPARPSGEPYFIRATIDDLLNPQVHSYAAGTISVVQLAAGTVDLFDIGRTKSGARFQGFNPGARLGSKVEGVSDFDGVVTDGVSIADFVMVAQFGNPQNLGPIGEAYLVYGRDRLRFGGTISVNSISNTVSGAIFQAPPVRDAIIQDGSARTNGITDVGMIPDVTGDGKPELIFGMSHVHGAYSSMDHDPGDTPIDNGGGLGCYPDLLVNNLAEDDSLDIDGWYAGGMVVIFNSSNRDSDGINVNIARLDSTAIPLEFVGQLGQIALDGGGFSSDNDTSSANIVVRVSNEFADDLGTDPLDEQREAGARFISGGFDFSDAFDLGQPAREGLFGQSVSSIGDLDADNVPEFIFSAPNNEAYFNSLAADFGTISTHAASTVWRHNVIIITGTNYNATVWRGRGDGRTSSLPSFSGNANSTCSPNRRVGRVLDFPPEAFQIIQEDANDRLGDGQSAGDFNRDGLDDILCGAPLNDRSSSQIDSGATYIVFGRSVFGDVDLRNADDPTLRPPMLRIRGVSTDDQIGWGQTAGQDVNGDRIDDVFIGSPRTDFGGVTGECRNDVDANGVIDADDYVLATFEDCVASFGDEVFMDDPCKPFDFDNDRDIDQGDRCIFCCLSDDCAPDATCTLGTGGEETCCDNVVNNGFVGVIFGGVFLDGDRDLSQLATSQLPGTRFFGGRAGDRAGHSISSAGDFNQDGFGDLLITAPGRTIIDSAGRERLGVVYLIFGGTHLINTTWSLDEVGSDQLPGMVFFSPYVSGRPNEAPPTAVGFIGDINNDGFGDIGIGNDRADFIDPTFPQGPDAPGSDPATGRRSVMCCG